MLLPFSFILLFIVHLVFGQEAFHFFDNLLNGYDSEMHPHSYSNQQLQLNFVFFIYHLSVPRTGSLKYNGFVKINWIDQRIAWNAADTGISVAMLPSNYSIWIPHIIQIDADGIARKVHSPRPRTSLRVFSKDRVQSAWISHTLQISGDIGCDVIRSFPYETLDCSLTWYSQGSLEEEILRIHSSSIFLKNLYMTDYEIPRLNGWKILNAIQSREILNQTENAGKLRPDNASTFLDPFNFTLRSGVVCRFLIQREDFTLALLTDLPQIVMAFLICFSWFTRPEMTVKLSIAYAYILSIFKDDLYHRIPENELVDFHTMALPILFLWLWNALTGICHLYMEFKPDRSWQMCQMYCSPYFRRWNSFLILESWLSNDKQRAADSRLELLLLRASLSLFLFFLFLLFVIFC